MGQELELKLHIDSPAQMEAVRTWQPLRDLTEGAEALLKMQTTYFDTPDGEISSRRWTFRQRRENDACITCLKTPGQDAGSLKSRKEWETEERDLQKAVANLVRNGAPMELASLTSDGVVPLCGAVFVRRAQILRFSDGSTCELACDAGELCGGTNRLPFYELELELKSGEKTQMVAFGMRLAQTFGLSVEPLSKFARAKMLAEKSADSTEKEGGEPREAAFQTCFRSV